MSQGSSNPTTNITRINGTTVSTNSGNTDAGTQRVVIATNQPTVPVSLASVPSHPVTNAGTFAVQVNASLPAGTNNIGDVDVLSLPPLPAGTNNIGDVDVLSLPPLPAGTNNIGDVDVLSLPPLPAGTNNIGDVDVLSLPALPTGTNTIGNVNVNGTVPVSLTSVPSHPVTNAGTFAVQVSSAIPAGNNNIGDVDIASLPGTVASDITAIKTGIELLDNAMGTDGTAVAAGVIRVGGTDGTNTQTISTTTAGHVNIADGGGSITVDGTVGISGTVPVSLASVPSHPVTNAGTFAVQVSAALPAGTNNIGDVDIVSMPALPAGTNTIGNVNVNGTVPVSGPLTDTELRATAVPVSLASVPSHPVTNAGTFAVQVSSAIPAGNNNIGDVDVASLPGTVAADITAIKTGVELLDTAIGTDGTAVGAGVIRVGGTDGTNTQTISTTTAGHVNIADGGGSITVDGTVGISGTVPVSLASVPSHPVTNAGTFAVQVSSALPTGSNTIGNVGINGTVPVSLASVPSHPVTNAGTFAVQVSSAIPAGNNNIGDVDVASLPGTVASDITAIKTGVELLDNAINTHDAVAGTAAVQIAGYASSVAPPVVVSGNSARIWTTPNGAVNVADGGGSLTVDGTVELGAASLAALENISVTIPGTVDLGTVSLTALETITVTGPLTNTELRATPVDVNIGASVLPINDNGGSITVDGNVGIIGTVPVSGTFWQATQPVSLASVPSHPVTNAGTFAVQVSAALPAGNNNIGDVDIASLPGTVATDITAIKTGIELLDNAMGTDGTAVGNGVIRVGGTDGTNTQTISTTTAGHVNIADGGGSITVDGTVGISGTVPVSLTSVPSHPVTNAGTFAVQVSSALPAGTNNIGDVDIVSLPGTVASDITAIKTGVELLDSAVGADGTAATVGVVRIGGTDGTNTQTISTTTAGHVNIADGGGSITVDGTVGINGTVPVSGPLTNTELRASAVPVSIASVPSHPVTNAGTFAVQVSSALPAGTNNIGDVDVLSLPALPTGTNTIGNVNVNGTVPVSLTSVPSHPVTNAGTFAVQVNSALPAGTNNIGDVGVVSLPGTVASDITAIKTGVELLDNALKAGSTVPTSTDSALTVSLGPNSKAYDPTDDMLKVKSMQKKFRDSFVGTSVDSTKWDSSIGTGGSINVNAGSIKIVSGTTINSETSILSKEMFTIPFRISANITLSQRIANQSFILEGVSVNPTTGIPDGLNTIAWVFDGTTVTAAKYRVANGGAAPLDSAASTITTTAAPGGVYELEPFADEAWFHSSVLDATTGRAVSYRRHQQIPDPNAVYKIRARWLNAGVAPASTSTATIQFIACQDYAELTAEITAGRGNAAAGQALGVQVLNAVTTNIHGVYATPVASTTYQPTNATTTAYASNIIVKASAGALYSITGFNSKNTAQFIQVHNSATLPADGAIPQLIFYVPPMSNFSFDMSYGRYFAAGIVICNSSTGPTKTIGSADCWFDVQYK